MVNLDTGEVIPEPHHTVDTTRACWLVTQDSAAVLATPRRSDRPAPTWSSATFTCMGPMVRRPRRRPHHGYFFGVSGFGDARGNVASAEPGGGGLRATGRREGKAMRRTRIGLVPGLPLVLALAVAACGGDNTDELASLYGGKATATSPGGSRTPSRRRWPTPRACASTASTSPTPRSPRIVSSSSPRPGLTGTRGSRRRGPAARRQRSGSVSTGEERCRRCDSMPASGPGTRAELGFLHSLPRVVEVGHSEAHGDERPCQGRGRGFKSRRDRLQARRPAHAASGAPGQVAQSVERAAENRKVGGSIPSLPTRFV
jgi:hypothetical protein